MSSEKIKDDQSRMSLRSASKLQDQRSSSKLSQRSASKI
jgi:hypothetical protein